MKTLAIVPVKRLSEAKGRLAGVLSSEERVRLARQMLNHVLSTLRASKQIEMIAVISPYPEELQLPPDVVALTQAQYGLNDLLEQGREWAVGEGADALLVIFSDLPLLTTNDIRAMVRAGSDPYTVVLAPDRHGRGTNALLSHPPTLAPFRFGPHSYSHHLRATQQAGARPVTYNSLNTALDLDTPDDLRRIASSQ